MSNEVKVNAELIEKYKTGYRLKVRSKRLSNKKEWEIIDCVFDEITRNRLILKAIPELPSDRINKANMIINILKFFQPRWPLYVYFKDKVITLPVRDVKVDDNEKKVVLVVD